MILMCWLHGGATWCMEKHAWILMWPGCNDTWWWHGNTTYNFFLCKLYTVNTNTSACHACCPVSSCHLIKTIHKPSKGHNFLIWESKWGKFYIIGNRLKRQRWWECKKWQIRQKGKRKESLNIGNQMKTKSIFPKFIWRPLYFGE